jgi:digeranylgeranylglycerophospholipid reductase
MYDIVVIGGNLAGTTAAITASEKGGNVAIIEKNESPHYPAHCGEGIDTTTASFIDFEKINCYTNPIEKMVIKLTHNKQYQIHFKKKGLIVFDRNYLEKKLLEKSKENGVDVLLGQKMIDYHPPNTIITDKHLNIKGKVIIDASGINCVIGKKMGMKPKTLPQDIGVCIQSRVKGDIDAKTMKTWFHKPYAPFGYGWVFPIDKDYANIGIGIPGGQHVDMHHLLQLYIQEELGSDYEIMDTFHACVPSAPPVNSMVKDNVLLTGDAARLVNAFLGSGIANAIVSGSLAGGIAIEYVQKKIPSLDAYQEILAPKINRLQKVYQKRNKTLFTASFYTSYKRGFFALTLMNKLLPNTFNKQVEKILGKDIALIKKHKKTPTLF